MLVGPAATSVPDGAVLVEGEVITAVGPRQEIEAQVVGEVSRRDFPEHTVLPGLINAHVHLAFDTTDDYLDTVRNAEDATLLLGMAGRAQAALRAGVTTVRDLGDRDGLALRLRDAIARGELIGPRILASGAPLTAPRGHCWFLGGEVSGHTAIRERVRRNAELGADVIKVMVSGGQITPESPPMWASQFDAEDLRVVVEEASALGLPVAAHAHGTEAIGSALEAGVSTIEHCTWMGPDGHDQREDMARRMAERGLHACIALDPVAWRALVARAPERMRQFADSLPWLAGHGVPMVFGTDAGLRGLRFDDPAGALALYESLGLARDRVLDMATVTAAAALGLGDRTGRVLPGCAADLLVVRGDPLADLTDLRNLRLVLARGDRVVDRTGED